MTVYTVDTLPTSREPGCPFDPPTGLRRAREHGPISRCPFPGGHEGWLVTGYDLLRSVLADPRFSSRKELMRHPTIDFGDMEIPPAPPGEFLLTDEPEHSRYRRPLVGKFTVRRMRLLTERIEQVTTEHLDAMDERRGPDRGLHLDPGIPRGAGGGQAREPHRRRAQRPHRPGVHRRGPDR